MTMPRCRLRLWSRLDKRQEDLCRRADRVRQRRDRSDSGHASGSRSAGSAVKAEALAEAAEKAKGEVDPVSDLRGSAGYKKEMAGSVRAPRVRKGPRRPSPVTQSQAAGQKATKKTVEEKGGSVKFTQSAQIPVAREALWEFLMDVPKVAQSLPGVETVKNRRYHL